MSDQDEVTVRSVVLGENCAKLVERAELLQDDYVIGHKKAKVLEQRFGQGIEERVLRVKVAYPQDHDANVPNEGGVGDGGGLLSAQRRIELHGGGALAYRQYLHH